MDLIDYGGPSTARGRARYIFHIRDHKSKFSWAYPLLKKDSHVIGQKLHELFCLVGPPVILQSDDGGEFKSDQMVRVEWNNAFKIVTKSYYVESWAEA